MGNGLLALTDYFPPCYPNYVIVSNSWQQILFDPTNRVYQSFVSTLGADSAKLKLLDTALSGNPLHVKFLWGNRFPKDLKNDISSA